MIKAATITAGIMALLCLSSYAFRVNPEQVAACVDHTGWTESRCQIELTR